MVIPALLLVVASALAADGPTDAGPAPQGYGSKQRLSAEDYERKDEGWYFTGLPLVNYDSNTGFGAGARAYFYFNADRTDPLFAFTPYRHRVFVQGFATTGGFQFHWLDYDVPSLFDSLWRFRGQLWFEKNTNRNYYGIGAAAVEPLGYPGSAERFATIGALEASQHAVHSDGLTWGQYHRYFFERPVLWLSVERSIFGGLLRPVVGLAFSYTRLGDYSGKPIHATGAGGADVEAPMGRSKVREDCDLGRLVGCEGGFDNVLRVGLAYDTRDYEPDPNAGVFVDLAVDLATRALGSRYDYVRVMLAGRIYHSPAPELIDLVFAARGTVELQSQGAPFFSMNTLPYSEDPRSGLGGLRTMRGFKQDRFVGPLMALANLELRWTFFRFGLLRQKFGLIAVPFLDLGRAWGNFDQVSIVDWRRGQGLALRISWNQATLIAVEYGVSDEDTGLYINFSHQF